MEHLKRAYDLDSIYFAEGLRLHSWRMDGSYDNFENKLRFLAAQKSEVGQ